MGSIVFYNAGTTPAAFQAQVQLQNTGFRFARHPGQNVTDLLLDVPSFSALGTLKSGDNIDNLLSQLSPDMRIWGGNLSDLSGMHTYDLLKDYLYVAENAAITADCALRMAGPLLNSTWKSTTVLILGWGRIGKQLSRILKSLACNVLIHTRSSADLALIQALGYTPIEKSTLSNCLTDVNLIFNTVPATILSEAELAAHPACTAIDLASERGLPGPNVISAKGLPGKMAANTSGKLIAESILRLGKDVF